MKAQTFDKGLGASLGRPFWLPWVLVGCAWAVAAAAGVFNGAGPQTGAPAGPASSQTGPPIALTAPAALAWSAAHPAPAMPSPAADPGAGADGLAPEVPPAADGGGDDTANALQPAPEPTREAAVPNPIAQPTQPSEPVRAEPRVAHAVRETATGRTTKIAQLEPKPSPAKEDTAVAEPKPAPADPKASSLAPPTTVLPTITINNPTEPAAPSSKETAQEATARATTHLNAKRWAEAEEAFGVALSRPGGRSAAVLYGRARARESQGDDEGAESDLNEALSIDPRHPYALLLLGDLAKGNSDMEGARKAYRRYVEAWPNGRRTGELTIWLGTEE